MSQAVLITGDNADADTPTVVIAGPQILVSVQINGFTITISKRNLEHFDAQDPYFFDSDYTIAGSTGFLLWEANWLLLRLLRGKHPHPNPSPTSAPPPDFSPTAALPPSPQPNPHPQPQPQPFHLGRLLAGRRVLDLGTGTGLAGLCAAACGAHVLLTDLASVCSGALRQNLDRNAALAPPGPQSSTTAAAELAAESDGAAVNGEEGGGGAEKKEEGREAEGAGPWAGSVRVGRGSAAVMALDWTEPLEPQVQAGGGNDPRDADFILAVDTIWLMDIFHCFLDVVMAVLRRGGSRGGNLASAGEPAGTVSIPECVTGIDSNPEAAAGQEPQHDRQQQPQPQPRPQQRACFLAFVERAGEESKLFVRKEAVVRELLARGCCVETLVAEEVDVDGVMRPGRVLRLSLAE